MQHKVGKSSNDRLSCLCDDLVRTTPPSHAAAAQANPAAAAAPVSPAVVSIAAAPVAAFDATIAAFT